MSHPDVPRVLGRVALTFRLANGYGGLTPDTKDKTWFFEVPAARDNEHAWRELLHRIFYDANVAMQRREPGDAAWLVLDAWTTTPVDEAAALAWDGTATLDVASRHLPWYVSQSRVVWEPAPCYWVDGAGRYDGLEANDFSELVVYRALAAGRVDETSAVTFLQKVYPREPGAGQRIFDARAERLANITCVRAPPPGVFRKVPGEEPVVSGPPAPAHVGR